ncbi:hypothetical protein SAMN04488029_0241 [Reichenbachiella faecimaris]|uniref:Uncharacterized protein n=1 Tax=Reichenbachiella faecimaris TaxID=692418 RepID=A0A1W2G5M5_REIFA|nr:hypothetical protein SAMN04488029_0241 [Reichenbachiella faecimaris]
MLLAPEDILELFLFRISLPFKFIGLTQFKNNPVKISLGYQFWISSFFIN